MRNVLLKQEKGDHFYTMAENLTKLWSRIVWKLELVITDLGYITDFQAKSFTCDLISSCCLQYHARKGIN